VNYGDDQLDASAITSTDARIQLLRKSVKYTFQHPLFGVGPGMFVVAEDEDAKAAGFRHGNWQGTHNSYTEVSSELGIPAFIFYLLVIFLSLKTTSRIYRKTRDDPRVQDIANIAICLNSRRSKRPDLRNAGAIWQSQPNKTFFEIHKYFYFHWLMENRQSGGADCE
jgi:O-antigen ligase